MDDLRAVLEAVGSPRTSIFAAGDGGDLALVFAATYPDRVQAVVVWDGNFRGSWAPDYPWAPPHSAALRGIDDIERRWPDSLLEIVAAGAPSLDDDERVTFARVLRLSVSPGAAAAYMRMTIDADVRAILPTVRVPTLILHPADQPDSAAAKQMASLIPSGQFAELARPDRIPVVGDTRELLARVRQFVAATPAAPPETERILATVLFTDIVGSTARATELGDRAWRELLERHHATVRAELARHRGVEHDTAGDGFFASFDGPGRAIGCAVAIQHALESLGIEIRAGLHAGECELLDNKMSGIAVAIGARVAARAAPGEVLVSQTVKDLVAGSGIAFSDRGGAELKGLQGEWRLYAVANA